MYTIPNSGHITIEGKRRGGCFNGHHVILIEYATGTRGPCVFDAAQGPPPPQLFCVLRGHWYHIQLFAIDINDLLAQLNGLFCSIDLFLACFINRFFVLLCFHRDGGAVFRLGD